MKKIYITIAVVVIVASATGIAVASIGGHSFFNSEKHNVMLEKKAEMLGLTLEELQERIEAGETLREIFEVDGVTKEDFLANKLDWMEQRLDDAVEAGKLTQEQADEKLAIMQEKMGSYTYSFDGTGKVGHARMGKGMKNHFWGK